MNRRVTFNVSAFDNGNELLFITGGEAGMSWAVTLSLGSVACPCERRKSISAKLFKLQSFTLQHEVRLRINKSLDMFETIRWDCSKGQTRLRLVIGADTHEKKSNNNVAYHPEHVTTEGGKVEAKWMQIYSPNAESDPRPSLRQCGRELIEIKREEETDSVLSPFNEKAQSFGKLVSL